MKSLLAAALAMPAVTAQIAPDLILFNGRVFTLDPRQPRVEAVACRDSRIVAAGSSAGIRNLAGPATRSIDLDGRLLLPGFNDAHVHFWAGGSDLASVQLRDAASETEFRRRIDRFAASAPAGRWILGGNWDHENWTPARLPTRQLIDPVSHAHPIFVRRLDGHMALANSIALQLAGISRNTPDPPGGAIVRDAAGKPTGVLKDAAMEPVDRVIPDASPAEIADALRAAMRHAAEHGITSIQDMSASPEILRVYQDLARRGELTVRVNAHQPLSAWQRLANVGVRAGFGSELLKIGGLKAFSDGSLGSTTALFFTPYTDAPATAGLPADDMIPESKLLDRIAAADQAGLQIAVHAIGDKANHTVLEMFRQAAEKNGPRDRRFRIEHAQHLTPADIRRFASQNIIASMQPYHLIDDGRWAEKRIGAGRAKTAYAFRSLLDAGVTLAFGSDWFVAPLEPLMGIYAAATRRTLDGKRPHGWIPEQKITVEEAIRAYTLGSAYASFEEDLKGSVEPGKLADFTVLSQDILSIDPALIHDVKVDLTIVGGKIVYQR